jgi:hypothetical protein
LSEELLGTTRNKTTTGRPIIKLKQGLSCLQWEREAWRMENNSMSFCKIFTKKPGRHPNICSKRYHTLQEYLLA